MSSRWIQRETDALAEVRSRLKDELASRPQYPDVIGDRRILRFLRGKQNDVNETVKMFSAFLKWRDENNVDDIRNQILYGGLDTPLKFPNGKKIIELAPQIIISAKAQDFKGQPLVLEQYSFSPSDLLSRVTTKDYLLFLIYSLEYRALVMEQMSHEKELAYLAVYPNPEDREVGYGVVLLNFCIRDLQGVGISHLTGKGKSVIEAAINIGLPNYPEYLGKCHMINVPWVFTSMWFFIKGLLDDFILAKINLTGSKYMETLLRDVPIESIPKALGGKFELYNESFAFDTSPCGPFYCPSLLKPAPPTPSTSMAAFHAPELNEYPDDDLPLIGEEVMGGRPGGRQNEGAGVANRSRTPARARPVVNSVAGDGEWSTVGAAESAGLASPSSAAPSIGTSARATTPLRSLGRVPSWSSMLRRSPSRPAEEQPHSTTSTATATPSAASTAQDPPPSAALSASVPAPTPLKDKAKLIGALRTQKLSITSPGGVATAHRISVAEAAAPTHDPAGVPLLGRYPLQDPGRAQVPEVDDTRKILNLKHNYGNAGPTKREMGRVDTVIAFAREHPVDFLIFATTCILFLFLDLWSMWKYVVLPVLLYVLIVHVL